MTESSYAVKIGERIPRHVAIIMDGNGRWAKARGKIRIFGHHAGVSSVRSSVQRAAELGVKVLTLFAFSSENWNRPEAEVSGLMKLFGIAIRKELPSLMKNGIKVRFIGDLSRFDRSLRQMLERAMEETRDNGALLLNIAVNYGGRWDIVNAARDFARDCAEGRADTTSLSEDSFSRYLSTGEYSDVDLLIRTGGDFRISNFLIWQLAYAEIYVTKTLWPDFGPEEFDRAVEWFGTRERRFGMTGDQVRKIESEKTAAETGLPADGPLPESGQPS